MCLKLGDSWMICAQIELEYLVVVYWGWLGYVLGCTRVYSWGVLGSVGVIWSKTPLDLEYIHGLNQFYGANVDRFRFGSTQHALVLALLTPARVEMSVTHKHIILFHMKYKGKCHNTNYSLYSSRIFEWLYGFCVAHSSVSSLYHFVNNGNNLKQFLSFKVLIKLNPLFARLLGSTVTGDNIPSCSNCSATVVQPYSRQDHRFKSSKSFCFFLFPFIYLLW